MSGQPTEVLIFGTLRARAQAEACARLGFPHRLVRADSPVGQMELAAMLHHFGLSAKRPLPIYVADGRVFGALGEALMAACPEDARGDLEIVVEDEPAIYGGKKTIKVVA